MKQVQIQCDRCKKIVDGIIGDVPSTGLPNRFTGGFYDVTSGFWGQFAKSDENNLCDKCLHSDTKYKNIYG